MRVSVVRLSRICVAIRLWICSEGHYDRICGIETERDSILHSALYFGSHFPEKNKKEGLSL